MRGLLLLLVLGVAAQGPVRVALAGTVKGTIALPPDMKSARRHPGYWRLENGIVPIQPNSSRGETVVVLTGVKGTPPAAKTVTVELQGLGASPTTLVVGEGSVVEFKNGDRVAHDLSTPDQPSFMSIERLNPGAVRRQKFSVAGGYTVRCAEYPQIAISVIVVNNPFFATSDEKGAFKLGEVPDGKATLRVWSGGRWVHEEEIDVGKGGDLSVKVASSAPKTGE